MLFALRPESKSAEKQKGTNHSFVKMVEKERECPQTVKESKVKSAHEPSGPLYH